AGQSRTGGPRWTVGETDWGRGRRGKLDFGYFRATGPQVISPGRRPGLTFVIGRGLKGRSPMAQCRPYRARRYLRRFPGLRPGLLTYEPLALAKCGRRAHNVQTSDSTEIGR